VNFNRQFFDQVVVLVVAHVQVFAVFSQHSLSPFIKFF
jgi:hypothetical protein